MSGTGSQSRIEPTSGFVDAAVQAEFPGLSLQWLTLPARRRPSPPSLIQRLRLHSDRYRGAGVVAMRTRPVPRAYRSFFRQIGLDPDVDRIPSERVAVARLLQGGFRSVDLISDACLVALLETGVPVWALDAARVGPGLGIRLAGRGGRAPSSEPGGDQAQPGGDQAQPGGDQAQPGGDQAQPGGDQAQPGMIVIADDHAVHARLFGDPDPGHGVGRRTERVTLFTVSVEGVPSIHVDEALWLCCDLLRHGSVAAGRG